MSIVYQIKKKVISHEDEPVVEEDFFTGLIDDENFGLNALLRRVTRFLMPQTTEDFIEILLYLFALILICLIIKYVNAIPSTTNKK